MKSFFWTLCFFVLAYAGYGQGIMQKKGWKCKITQEGCIERIVFEREEGKVTIPFFQTQEKAGPVFYFKENNQEQKGEWQNCGENTFKSKLGQVECLLKYEQQAGWPALAVKLTNWGKTVFQPQKAGLKLGIDTYMDKYPDWFNKYFPTLMRCEKTFFYGYLQTPGEHTLAIVSEQPIASWSVDYNLGYMDPAPHWFMGHRIESLNLDLLNELPLPERHPDSLYCLWPGESKSWVISLVDVGKLENLESAIRQVAKVPMIDATRTAFHIGETAVVEIFGNKPTVEVTDDNGEEIVCKVYKTRLSGRYRAIVTLPKVGLYTLKVQEGEHQAEAILSVLPDWRWTIEKARENTGRYHQKATSHIESWYGFYSAFLAARYFPVTDIDQLLNQRFELLFNLLHDTVKMEPKYYASRIQNTAGTIGLLTDKFEAGKDIYDLERACRLADWLIGYAQREDGAYYNRNTVYTSVIYIAKSILELALAEKELGKIDAVWQAAYERHYASAKRAIDQLVNARGNFQTEGEMTFEDGMISCSALQIGMFALLQEDKLQKEHYTKAMLEILNSHSCLTQLRVSDARRRQGTMRYWEAQYDVQMLPNMFNSPHGWSAWRAYATYYAYLLTGEEKWLIQTFNAMGAFANLIDYKTGDLRWAFVVDPHLEVEQACSADSKYTFDDLSFGNPHPRLYQTRKFVIGEQYVNMISDWQTVNTQDNDVHEVFKCIGETVLTNAYLVLLPDGELHHYNCKAKATKNGDLLVTPLEEQMEHLHYNLSGPLKVIWKGKEAVIDGMGWLD